MSGACRISASRIPLPIWIFNNLFRPNQAPVVNVVAAVLIVISVLPVWLAQRIAGPASGASR